MIGTSHACDENNECQKTIDALIQSIPDGWSYIDTEVNASPYGHEEENALRGFKITLAGDRNVVFSWKDDAEQWHQEPLATEALELWIIPSQYRRSWRRFFTMKAPEPASLIYENDHIKVYGLPTARWRSQEAQIRFNELVPSQVIETHWIESPRITKKLSWASWKEDVARVFRELM